MTTNEALIERVHGYLADTRYLDYEFVVREGHGGVFVQATYWEDDVVTGEPQKQYTRKWHVSPHATKSELVQTFFKLCITSAEHRCREAFHYGGHRVFGPHFDIDDVVAICRDGRNEAGARASAS